MNQEQGVTVLEDRKPFELVSATELTDNLTKLTQFQNVVRTQMCKDVDYGVIPGTHKPSLYKPGAEKLLKMHGLSDRYEIVEKIEDWDKPLFRYLIKCTAIHAATGTVISEGLGEANSMETKWRYRNGKDNTEVYSVVNTILKMAKKRAMVDACLGACRLSAVFTQDVEDLKANGVLDVKPTTATTSTATPTTVPTPSTSTTPPKPSAHAESHPVSPKQISMLWAVARKVFGDEAYSENLFAAIKEMGIELPIKKTQKGHDQPDVQALTMDQWTELLNTIAPGTLKPREA